MFYPSCNILKPLQTMGEKQLIALAEIVSLPLALLILHSVSRAAAPAQCKIRTRLTFLVMIGRILYIFYFFPPLLYLRKACIIQVAQPVIIQHIKVTGIYLSIRLHHVLNSADSPLLAALRLPAQQNRHIIFKLPDIWLSAPLQIQIP